MNFVPSQTALLRSVSTLSLLALCFVFEASLASAQKAPAAETNDEGAPVSAEAEEPAPPVSDTDMLDEELRLLDEEVFAEEEPTPDAPEPGATSPAAAPLEGETMPSLREVTVRYKPEDIFRMGGSVQQMDEVQLQRQQYEDPNAVVVQLPGVYVRQEDAFGLRPNIGMRGASSDRSRKLTLMEDGVLFGPAPYSAPAAYYFPIMTRMTGVEVFKGPASILYGPNTIGGALNLLSRPVPEEPRGQVDVAYGRFRSLKAHLHYGAHNDWGGYVVEGVHLGSRGFKDIDGPFGTDDTGFQRGELMLKGYVNTKPDKRVYNRLELKFTGSRERSNETYLGLSDEDFRDDPYRRYAASQLDNMSWWRTAVQLRHDLAIGDHVALETSAYRHDFQRTWERLDAFDEQDDPSLLEVLDSPSDNFNYYQTLTGEQNSAESGHDLLQASNGRDFVVMGIQTKLRSDFATGKVEHEIESGLRFHYDSVERDQPRSRFAMQQEQLVFEGTEPDLLVKNQGEAQALAGYLMYGLRARGFTAKPGVRVEWIRTFFEDQTDDSGRVEGDPQLVALPGIGLQYSITDEWAVLAGVHRGFSPVSPESREPKDGSGDGDYADPELSVNYEAGARYVTESGLGFGEVIGFFNDYSNITGTCTGSAGCEPDQLDQQFNGGRAFIGGVELLGGYTLTLPKEFIMPFRGTYTYTNASFRTSFDSADPVFGSVDKGDEVPYVPRHQLNLQAGLEKSFWSLYFTGTYFGSMREGQVVPGGAELPRTDDYFVLDFMGRVRFEPVEAYLRLQNITNAQAIVARRPFGARPNAPFSAQVGVQVTF